MSNNFDLKLHDDLSGIDEDKFFCDGIIFFEIVGQTQKNIVVEVIYRPPNANVDAFVSKQYEVVQKLSREKQIMLYNG